MMTIGQPQVTLLGSDHQIRTDSSSLGPSYNPKTTCVQPPFIGNTVGEGRHQKTGGPSMDEKCGVN
eukprot:754678-Pelagomonas_calceolata.AAC.4